MKRESDETSPGGSRIFRHEDSEERALEPAFGDAESLEALTREIERIYGPIQTVWHEIVSDMVHIDVHVIAPGDERPFYTLVTTGMSDRPMTVPDDCEDFRFAELVLRLPPDWPFPSEKHADTDDDEPDWYWPVRWMKSVARLPHEYSTWLAFGHTIPNDDPPVPFVPGTQLCGWMLLPDLDVSEEDWVLTLQDGRKVNLYALHALTLEEMNLKLEKGVEELVERLAKGGYTSVLDPGRASLVKKKRRDPR